MGQKVSPNGLRVGVVKKWSSYWITASKNQAHFLHQDIKIRKVLNQHLKRKALVGKVVIERPNNKDISVIIHTAKPGFVMGEDGVNIKKLTLELNKAIGRNYKINLRLELISNPSIHAKLIAENIAEQLENRASFRTIQKRAIQSAMRSGVKGIKTKVSGRLAGADMARTEGYSEGIIPLHTIRSNVEYAFVKAHTTYGILGVKVWVCHGEILEGME